MYMELRTELLKLRESAGKTGMITDKTIEDMVNLVSNKMLGTCYGKLQDVLGVKQVQVSRTEAVDAAKTLEVALIQCYKEICDCTTVAWGTKSAKKWYVYLDTYVGEKGSYDVGWVMGQRVPGVCYFGKRSEAYACREWLNELLYKCV